MALANLTDPLELKIANESSRLLLQFILAHRGSLTLDDVILNRDYRICPGDLRLNWNGAGYRTILDVLIRKIPDPSQQLPFEQRLQLNKEVSNVNWGDSAVRVTCSDGSVFVGDHVIFTPSVGVLKHDHEALFTPGLPKEKRSAIADIGLGAIVDVSFYFPTRWWPDDNTFSGYYFVWDENDLNTAVEEYGNLTQNVSKTKRIAPIKMFLIAEFNCPRMDFRFIQCGTNREKSERADVLDNRQYSTTCGINFG